MNKITMFGVSLALLGCSYDVAAEIRMGLKDLLSPVVETDGLGVSELYHLSIRSVSFDFIHPVEGVESVSSCNGIVELSEAGYTPLTVYDYTASRHWSALCKAMIEISLMRPYDVNYFTDVFPGGVFGSGFADIAPLEFMATLPGSHVSVVADTWGEAVNIVREKGAQYTRSPYERIFFTDKFRHVLRVLDIGDYTGDGVAEVVVQYDVRLWGDALERIREDERENDYMYSGYFVLGRGGGDGPVHVVKHVRPVVVNDRDIAGLERKYSEEDVAVRVDLDYIRIVLMELPLRYNKSLVEHYNNIGYYLEQGGNFESAIYILQRVIDLFPGRDVAYINLGDALWGGGKKSDARLVYEKYINLMRDGGRKDRIPKRVFERASH